MPTVTKSLGTGTQSVLLTMSILESLARKKEAVSISELAREIGTSKSRVFRHLQTLTTCDYVIRSESSGKYDIGSKLYNFGAMLNARFDLVEIALPYMERLQAQFNHTVIISRVETNGLRVLHSLTGLSSFVINVRPGTLLPFESSAQGRAVLASIPSTEVEAPTAIAEAYRKLSSQESSELASIRDRGWGFAQLREGLSGLGAPILNAEGSPIGSLGLLGMAQDIDQSLISSLGYELSIAASSITSRIHGNVPN